LLIRGSPYSFTDYFKGLENAEAVHKIFGARTEEILRSLKVEFTWMGGYMWVNGANGHIVISSRYLREGDKTEIYLDLIHELVHVRQFIDGKELFDENLSYVDRPTEIEAYKHAVEEARRLGLNDEKIYQYLRAEWMSQYDLERLAKVLRVKCSG
jgi:hypothetical protein